MVADTIHRGGYHSLQDPLHPTFNFMGHEFTIDLPIPTVILSSKGALFLLTYAYSWIRLLLELFVIPGVNVKTFKSRNKSSWAIVTGATAGIGLEFAKQLASKGFNIVLVGRRQSALDEISQEIAGKYGVETKNVRVDVSKPTTERAEAFSKLEKMSHELDVAVLVNNVGASHEMPVSFAETDPEEMDTIIQTNVVSTLHLTRLILPQMLARSAGQTSPPSLILNIGSMSGRITSPLLATYSGTKECLSTWSQAVAEEVKDKRVMVRLILPAFVATNMSKIRKASLTAPSPKSFVHSTLTSLNLSRGAQGRLHTSTPYWSHAMMDYVVGLFGGLSENVAVRYVGGMHVDIRRRALRRKARDAGKGKSE